MSIISIRTAKTCIVFQSCFFFVKSVVVALSVAVIGAQAEKHIVHFVNRCGRGTPRLIQGPNTLSTGADYVSNGPLRGAIAYLQTGSCGFNGEGCTLIETTLVNPNPAAPGSGSSTDISLIPPLKFSVTSGFGYYNGCDGAGANCQGASCSTAFKKPSDTHVQVACQKNDVNLAITFC